MRDATGRIGAAVDQVAKKNERIGFRIARQHVEQVEELRATAMYVAHDKSSHSDWSPGTCALAFDAIHQLDETWILVHVGPVWIRLKPLVVFISETDGRFQPSQRFHLAALQEICGRKPVRYIVIRLGNLPDFRRELFVGFRVLSLCAQTDRENRSARRPSADAVAKPAEESVIASSISPLVVKHTRAEDFESSDVQVRAAAP